MPAVFLISAPNVQALSCSVPPHTADSAPYRVDRIRLGESVPGCLAASPHYSSGPGDGRKDAAADRCPRGLLPTISLPERLAVTLTAKGLVQPPIGRLTGDI